MIYHFAVYSMAIIILDLSVIKYKIRLPRITLILSFLTALIIWIDSFVAFGTFGTSNFLPISYHDIPKVIAITGVIGALLNNGILEYHYPSK